MNNKMLLLHVSNTMSVKTGNWGTDELHGLTVLHAKINYHNLMLISIRCPWENRGCEFEACLIPGSTMCISSFGWFWVVSFSYQFSSVAQSCLNLCHPMNRSTPGLPVHHQLPESTQIHVHAIQPSHSLSSPSPPAPNPSQHQSLFQWVNSSHEVAKVLELQL